MSENDAPIPKDSCNESIELHMIELMGAMEALGLGGGCRTTYEALIELAELFNLHYAWGSYTPVVAAREYAIYRASKDAAAKSQFLAKGPETLQ